MMRIGQFSGYSVEFREIDKSSIRTSHEQASFLLCQFARDLS